MNKNKLKKGYTGYKLTTNGRSDLLVHIEPVFSDVIAHHVTHEFGVYDQLPPETHQVRVVAEVITDTVQAVVVIVNGSMNRPGGGTYHITVSIDKSKGAKPKDSNDAIADSANWTNVDPFNIDVTPEFFAFRG